MVKYIFGPVPVSITQLLAETMHYYMQERGSNLIHLTPYKMNYSR